MDEVTGLMTGGLGLAILLFLAVLAVMLFLMPFFIYGTNARTKQTAIQLARTNALLADIRDELRKR